MSHLLARSPPPAVHASTKRCDHWAGFLRASFVLAGLCSVAAPCASARTPALGRPGATPLPSAMPIQDQDLCQAAIRSVLPSTDLPPALLGAIGKVESGRSDPLDGSVKPWPWTINAEGQGTLFSRREDAVAAVLSLQARGVASIDVGCMQVNLAYHPNAFATLDDAFDPVTNVRYAARFLRQLFAQTGDWDSAAAAYHSRTPDIAAPYRLKVLAAMGNGARAPALAPAPVHNHLALAWAATVSPTFPGLGGDWSADPVQLPSRLRLARAKPRQSLALATNR